MKKRNRWMLGSMVILFVVSLFSFRSFVQAETTGSKLDSKAVSVTSASQLEEALKAKKSVIRIDADFTTSRTFYIARPTTIYSNQKHVIKRGTSFAGDIFVVGENAKGRNSHLDDLEAILNLGDSDSTEENLLIIDGNRDNMKVDVAGSAIFMCYSPVVNIYDNVTIQNCHKVTNSKSLNEKYTLPYTKRVGGAMIIVSSGALNIYGGNFKNNETNQEYDPPEEELEKISDADRDFDTERESSLGGAIFNYGNIRLYGGYFSDNYAARGGAIYNYRMIHIFDCTFKGNGAQKYGGAIYQAESQYGEIIFGGDTREEQKTSTGLCDIRFEENYAIGTGGAIFSQTKNAMVFYPECHTTFVKNRAVRHNGGAIACSGTLNLKGGVTFSENDANSKGGALYLSNSHDELVVRQPLIQNAVFEYNTAARGGAVGMMAKAVSFEQGGIGTFENCTFTGNRAIAKTPYGEDELDPKINGGAVYISRKSIFEAKDCIFTNNVSEGAEAGAIYETADSTATLTGCQFDGNETKDAEEGNGGAIAVHGAKMTICDSKFMRNHSARHGAALYISYKNDLALDSIPSYVKVTNSRFASNESDYHGGACYVTSMDQEESEDEDSDSPVDYTDSSYLELRGCTLKSNQAKYNGGAVYVTKSIAYLCDNEYISNIAMAQSGKYGGGAVYATKGKLDIDSARMIGNESNYNGGAIALYSNTQAEIRRATVTGNSAKTQGGGIYLNKSEANIYDSSFINNTTESGGGAISCYTDATLNLYDSSMDGNNVSGNGGSVYIRDNKAAYFRNVEISHGNASGEYGGGGIYVHTANLEASELTISENQGKKGAALYMTGGRVVLNKAAFTENNASERGGAIYTTSGSELKIYDSAFTKNTSADNAGAIATMDAENITKIYGTKFTQNEAGKVNVADGGAMWIYKTNVDGNTVLQNCTFTGNTSSQYGGAISVTSGGNVKIYDCVAEDNQADKYGGFIYSSAATSRITINGLSLKGNKALQDKGTVAYTSQASFTIKKDSVVDQETLISESYWSAPKWQIPTIQDLEEDVPIPDSYHKQGIDYEYKHVEVKDQPIGRSSISVDTEIFDLAEKKKLNYEEISSDYNKLPKLTNKTNFQSLGTTSFSNINGATVKVDSFVYNKNKKADNTTLPIGIMIYQAMDYKRHHPDEEVTIDFSAFRISVETAVCINRNSKYFGYMRNLEKTNYDTNGFVRVSYLLVSAARMGIHVTVVGQLDGYPQDAADLNLKEYFVDKYRDSCDPVYAKGRICDYLNFQYCYWTSYDNDAATDMMHNKNCVVSNYRDKDGKDHGSAVWFGSSNLDGINPTGTNGHNHIQTAVVISGHEQLARVSQNFIRLVAKYCGQEDVYEYRELVNQTMTEQIAALNAGETVDPDEQIVYPGTKTDKVFELYYAPFGGNAGSFDVVNNPFCKYIDKLNHSEGYIWFVWNNVKFVKRTFALARTLESKINEAFTKNPNKNNRAYILLPDSDSSPGFDGTKILKLKPGKQIKCATINKKVYGTVHNKDVMLSYVEKGKRTYVSLLNSMNIHQGSMSYQTNYALVIKETNGNKPESVFYKIADKTTNGIVRTDITKLGMSVDQPKNGFTYTGKDIHPKIKINLDPANYTIVYPKDCKSVGVHTLTVKAKGTGYRGSKKMTFKIIPSRTPLKKLTGAKKSIKVTWKKCVKKMNKTRITGYQLQFATNAKFTTNVKTVTVKGYKKVARTVKGLKAKRKYYVRIRTYKTVKKVTYRSKWSAAKTVKTK